MHAFTRRPPGGLHACICTHLTHLRMQLHASARMQLHARICTCIEADRGEDEGE